jgi:hypothetical protein
MSIAAYAQAVRDYLRSNLSNFYNSTSADINRNCKIMPDEHPTADCGQEFIAIYGSYHSPGKKDLMMAIDEHFGITIAVSRKIALVPPDYRGELGYLNTKSLPSSVSTDDSNTFLTAWKSTEARCREIVKLVAGTSRYTIMANANALIDASYGGPITEPLQWFGTDPAPKQVDSTFFFGYQDPQPDSDNIFGLVQQVRFGDAVRMQRLDDFDRIPT